MALEYGASPASDFVEYNRFFKKWYGVILIGFLCLIVFVVILYITFLRRLDVFQGTWIVLMLSHIKREILSNSFLGLFYICLFGGLFFIFVPIEAFYITILKTGRLSFAHILLMILGLLISYSFDYVIGLRLSRFSKKLISPKKFYRTKILVNRFGKFAILCLNLIGFGSQQLTFVLGVFRYNKTRLLVFSATGQILKYVIITIFVLGIFG